MAYFHSIAKNRYPIGRELVLKRNQVFILPTKQGLAFVGMLGVILLVGINYRNNLSYGLCFLLASTMLGSILFTWRNLMGLALSNVGADSVFVGDKAEFRIYVESSKQGYDRHAITLVWSDVLDDEVEEYTQSVNVSKQNTIEILLSKETFKRGVFDPGRIRVETRFPLGLFVAWTEVDLLCRVLVYPRPIEAPLAMYSLEGNEVEGLHPIGNGVGDFQGLRPYQPGDSKKLINWKSFSKEQGLFAKDFTGIAGEDPYLDFNKVTGDVENRLSVLCYWIIKLSKEQRAFGIKLPNVNLSPAIGETHTQKALESLAMYGAV